MTPTTIKTIRGAVEAEVRASSDDVAAATYRVQAASESIRRYKNADMVQRMKLVLAAAQAERENACERHERAKTALAEFNAAYPEAK